MHADSAHYFALRRGECHSDANVELQTASLGSPLFTVTSLLQQLARWNERSPPTDPVTHTEAKACHARPQLSFWVLYLWTSKEKVPRRHGRSRDSTKSTRH